MVGLLTVHCGRVRIRHRSRRWRHSRCLKSSSPPANSPPPAGALSSASAVSRKPASRAPHSRRELSQPSQPLAHRTIDRLRTTRRHWSRLCSATDYSAAAAARRSDGYCRCAFILPRRRIRSRRLCHAAAALRVVPPPRCTLLHNPSCASCASSSVPTWKRQPLPMPTRCSFVTAGSTFLHTQIQRSIFLNFHHIRNSSSSSHAYEHAQPIRQ